MIDTQRQYIDGMLPLPNRRHNVLAFPCRVIENQLAYGNRFQIGDSVLTLLNRYCVVPHLERSCTPLFLSAPLCYINIHSTSILHAGLAAHRGVHTIVGFSSTQ